MPRPGAVYVEWVFAIARYHRGRRGRIPSGYAQRLENAGFTGVRVESIADMIYAPFIKFVRDRLRSSEFRVRMKPYLRWVTAASNVDWLLHKDIDYVIAVADKS